MKSLPVSAATKMKASEKYFSELFYATVCFLVFRKIKFGIFSNLYTLRSERAKLENSNKAVLNDLFITYESHEQCSFI